MNSLPDINVILAQMAEMQKQLNDLQSLKKDVKEIKEISSIGEDVAKEVAEIEKKAKFLSSSQGLGLSLERAKEVARLMNTWRKSSLKSMTEKELNKYSTELLGFTVSGAKEAMNSSFSGDSTKLNELVNIAAEKNGITPEHATKLLNKAFNIQ